MKFLLDGEETTRLYLRKINNSDFDSWFEFFNHPSSFEHWAAQLDKPDIECKKWFDRQAERYEKDEGGMNALIEKQSGKLIGYCGLLVQTVDKKKELEVAYSLLPVSETKVMQQKHQRNALTLLSKITLLNR